MEPGDRFHGILCSLPVCFDDKSRAEVVLTFFIIRRKAGHFTICHISKTYDSRGRAVTRSVQTKDSIPAAAIDAEIADIRELFAKGVEKGCGRRLEWDYLDLGGTAGTAEQVRLIREWGRVAAYTDGSMNICLN
jgi:hypothetical protein